MALATARGGGGKPGKINLRPKEIKKVDDKYLKQKGINAHQLKKGYGGSKADIYVNKRTGDLSILLKGGKGEPQPLHINIRNNK